MAEKIVTIQITLKLDVDDTVTPELLDRYLTKAVDNGLENGLDGSLGVVVLGQQTEVEI